MAQYDLIFVKNIASSGIEFSEQILAKPAGAGYFITQDSGSGVLSWSKTLSSPVINGTVSGDAIVTTLESAPAAGKLVDALTVYNKINNHLAANDAMVFKGTIGTGGTLELSAFNALTTYSAGWSYKVITAGTYRGHVCEIGDMLLATVDRSGTGAVDADWTAVQTNMDGLVTGPASAVDGRIAVFNGTSGKSIRQYNTLLASELATTANLITDINALGSGTIAKARLYAFTKADVGLGNVANVDTTNASNITSGSLPVAQVPNLTAAKITDFSTAVFGASTNAYKATSQTLTAAITAISADMAALESFSTANALKRTATKPTGATAAGTLYDIHLDPADGYMYVCLVGGAAGTARWKRAALASW